MLIPEAEANLKVRAIGSVEPPTSSQYAAYAVVYLCLVMMVHVLMN